MLNACEICEVGVGKVCKNMKTGKRKKTPHDCRVEHVPSITRTVSAKTVSVETLVSGYLSLTSEEKARLVAVIGLLNG